MLISFSLLSRFLLQVIHIISSCLLWMKENSHQSLELPNIKLKSNNLITKAIKLSEVKWSSTTYKRKHCSHMKLMKIFLIMQIVGWVSDNMATYLWRVGIHDYNWHLILCFKILYKSSTFQLLLVFQLLPVHWSALKSCILPSYMQNL